MTDVMTDATGTATIIVIETPLETVVTEEIEEIVNVVNVIAVIAVVLARHTAPRPTVYQPVRPQARAAIMPPLESSPKSKQTPTPLAASTVTANAKTATAPPVENAIGTATVTAAMVGFVGVAMRTVVAVVEVTHLMIGGEVVVVVEDETETGTFAADTALVPA